MGKRGPKKRDSSLPPSNQCRRSKRLKTNPQAEMGVGLKLTTCINESKEAQVQNFNLPSWVMAAPEDDDSQSKQSSHFSGGWDIDDPDDSEEGSASRKELRMLSFSHPGKFMDNFDPERSTREMRKMNRRIYRETLRKNQLYDEIGRLVENSRDLCDCLEVDCPGCHFPCNRCGSPKCGTECRCNRKWVYEFVEVEGTEVVIRWPTELKS